MVKKPMSVGVKSALISAGALVLVAILGALIPHLFRSEPSSPSTPIISTALKSNSGSQLVNNGTINGNIYLNTTATNKVELPQVFDDADHLRTNTSEPFLTRIFYLLNDKGSSFSFGEVGSENYMKFTLGDLKQEETDLFQYIILEGDGFGFRGTYFGYTNDTDYLDVEVVIQGGKLQLSRPPEIAFSLQNGKIIVLGTKYADIKISLLDKDVTSLKIKVELSNPLLYSNAPH
jgi:hypothetical protein